MRRETDRDEEERSGAGPRPALSLVPAPQAEPSPPDFDTLYREHHARLVRLAYLLTRSEETAHDLVQDVFARVYLRYDAIHDHAPYLRKGVVNACMSWHRRRRLERSRQPHHETVAELGADELFDVLATLPARQRAAIVLRFYEDLSEREAAAVLGCRPATVSSLVHRALARLRSELGAEGEA